MVLSIHTRDIFISNIVTRQDINVGFLTVLYVKIACLRIIEMRPPLIIDYAFLCVCIKNFIMKHSLKCSGLNTLKGCRNEKKRRFLQEILL